MNTLFQPKNATDSDLRREFESFGSIERVRIVRDKNGRSRGYAFIVFERERDMKGWTTSASTSSVSSPQPQLHTRNLTAWLSWVSVSSLMWNVAGPFEVGNPVDSEVASGVVQSQNLRCPSQAEEDSVVRIAASVVDSVVAEGEDTVDEAEGSAVVGAASAADVMTLGVAGVAVDTAVADFGV